MQTFFFVETRKPSLSRVPGADGCRDFAKLFFIRRHFGSRLRAPTQAPTPRAHTGADSVRPHRRRLQRLAMDLGHVIERLQYLPERQERQHERQDRLERLIEQLDKQEFNHGRELMRQSEVLADHWTTQQQQKKQLTKLGKRFDELDGRFDALVERFNVYEAKLDEQQQKQLQMQQQIDQKQEQLLLHQQQISWLTSQLQAQQQQNLEMLEMIRALRTGSNPNLQHINP